MRAVSEETSLPALMKVAFVGLAGAATAIPGMMEIAELPLPDDLRPWFRIVLPVTSSLVVLLVWVGSERLASLPDRSVVGIGLVGILGVFGFLFLHVWLTNTVFVDHAYERTVTETQFFPLYLSDRGDSLVRAAGSRRAFIEEEAGPMGVEGLTTEANTALTVVTLLANYTALVGFLALSFTVLVQRAVSKESRPDP